MSTGFVIFRSTGDSHRVEALLTIALSAEAAQKELQRLGIECEASLRMSGCPARLVISKDGDFIMATIVGSPLNTRFFMRKLPLVG